MGSLSSIVEGSLYEFVFASSLKLKKLTLCCPFLILYIKQLVESQVYNFILKIWRPFKKFQLPFCPIPRNNDAQICKYFNYLRIILK